MEKYVKIKIFVELECHPKRILILQFNQYIKSDKLLYIIYADLESLIKNIDECANNSEKSSTTKIVEHIPCR